MAGLATFVLGYPLRTILITGLALNQVGEFSFVLAQSGLKLNLLPPDAYQIFLAVSILTMLSTPFVFRGMPRLVAWTRRLPLPPRLKTGIAPDLASHAKVPKSGHLIIVGFGVNGKSLARAAQATQTPFVAVEMNPDVVRVEHKKGIPIWYGDATHDAVLAHVHAQTAKVAVIAVSDPVATRRITWLMRQRNAALYIIVRTHYLQDVPELYNLGASLVVPEELETSILIFSQTLERFGRSPEDIDAIIDEVRRENYALLTPPPVK